MPLRSLNTPALTTRSPALRPERMLMKSPRDRPVRTNFWLATAFGFSPFSAGWRPLTPPRPAGADKLLADDGFRFSTVLGGVRLNHVNRITIRRAQYGRCRNRQHGLFLQIGRGH